MQGTKIFVPTVLDSEQRFKLVEAAGETSFAINESDELYGWGKNDSGQVGQDTSIVNVSSPVKIMQSKGLTIAPGNKHVFAFNKSSKVVCWGYNENGQLGKQKSGVGKPAPLKIFQEAREIGLQVSKIACGENHSLAILTDTNMANSLFSWGNNKFWQLAVDAAEDVPYPFKTDFQQDPVQIAAKHNFSALVTRDGRVFSWGSGQFGRLGYETLTKQERVPRQITELQKIEKIALGIYHGIALNYDGRVYSWGRGLNGQLGHNTLNNENRPKIIAAVSQFKIIAITAGEHHSLFLGRGGEVWSCGGGSFGQLGLGDKVLRCLVPTKIDIGTSIMLAAGSRHSLALNISGEIYCWGGNDHNQLGFTNSARAPLQKKQEPALVQRVKNLEETIEELKEALLEQRRFKIGMLKFLQRNFGEAANAFHKFLKQS